tara:strand:- start:617 stop:901 length:285 start_codon:yes stop_codon:yes gene_type:complete
MLTFATAITVHRFNSEEITQIILSLPRLNSSSMQIDLEKDLKRLSGVKFIESSIISKTMVLNYDSKVLSPKYIYSILEKWGCKDYESSFRKISL